MKGNKLLQRSIRTFFQNWGAYVSLVIVINLLLGIVVVPIMQYMTGLILQVNRIPYLSYTNAVWLLTQRPLAVVELFILLLVIFAMVFWQFAFLLSGINNIALKQNLSLWGVFKIAIHDMRGLRLGSFLFFIGYFILVLPFSVAYLNSPLLSKATIPVFILDDLEKNPLIAILLTVLGVAVFYLGIRLIQVLPMMIIHHQKGLEAAKNSWQLTSHNTWQYLWRIFVLGIISFASTTLVSYLLYLFQTYLDAQSKVISFVGAVTNMGLLTVWQRIVASFSVVVFMLILLMVLDESKWHSTAAVVRLPRKRRIGRRVMGALLIGLFLVGDVAFNAVYLQGALLTKPITISHRGVDDGNGVQNTIPALNKTSKEKPDYVEMDLHETRDHQFVVMHDENLWNLAGVNKDPYQLTLSQMTKMKVHENGHTAHIASFNQYLRAAEHDHQKLLVEIKTTRHDSQNMLQLFIKRYENRLLRDHDRIHSLDYHVISGLKKQAPKLFVSYILPYNFSFPQTKANAYTMEETTLNETFVNEAHFHHQQVYAWTVDDEDDMTRMLFLNVDGIITDNLTELQSTINSTFDHPSYAQRLLIYSNELQDEEN
ncbi:glycerophosphoryl diester phosphodiesterase membrane domain-containing protein [Lentilactobacillus buchneri]|uniref:glycerophosphoryl diester phosphodiesterase membrane domain-containing protein n=1 Tax=Lentilactobacillus buchneri TaxID=1581 RepID=UPI0002076324|nr:glycerophosphodiester phosphodiesterase [Lentilactobacillus buchneri]AEB74490.1 Glycerophosphoryl diester phosphodiesterase, membrane domain protein [Lentilactobacillus buchneri NRRL B-30929]MCT2882345.1 glycerophosphodiester phosphodiesterase [Lentilactobacillus buchneri]MCT2899261.1 glycerophosphodiester phosphodiesterase [Lentilactobacillus buchneri]MCT3555475.1 glycerophosphodiester phosphodiesterase [Lentilactobacillus buchneri]MCT3558698.1 glycerophosphodiester phosphodiesterase [Lent